ncbi:DUF444 family protein, partial [Pseudomonas aeruginosa]|uniref:DUF444 family protein n=1 Tax=Pseudomonas aeruginosa TaxID=287 RepID=UPI0031B72957
GGRGIIVLAVAILPILGVGGMQLYRAEMPGPLKDNKMRPMFHQGRGGLRHRVHPGNDHFVQNDRIERPQGGGGGSGSGQGQASQDGEGQDEFVFQISKDEYLDLLF